jgi:hypothetical protein
MRNRSGVVKRRADLPPEARGISDGFSKADVLEAAWHLASLANDAGSVDDNASTRIRLLHELHNLRAQRGARPAKL